MPRSSSQSSETCTGGSAIFKIELNLFSAAIYAAILCYSMPFPSTETSCEGSEFHLATPSGDEEKVKELIAAGTNVDTPVVDTWDPGANRRTPLHYAAAGGESVTLKSSNCSSPQGPAWTLKTSLTEATPC